MKSIIMKLTPGQLRKIQNYFIRIVATVVVAVIISCSMTIDAVEQPSEINGGEVLHATLTANVTTNTDQTSKLMIAILVPKIWNARQKATVTFTSEVSSGIQQMTVIPAGAPAPNGQGLDWPSYLASKIGNGGNLINDWEWVAFYSNSDYTLPGNADVDVEVYVSIPTTEDNISFKMGYAIANSSDGLSESDRYGSFFPGCLRVNGNGDLIDFCNPQLASVEPRTATDNDIITITFDSGVSANDLENSTDVYLCATGVTTTGERLEVCLANDQSKLVSLGAGRFRIDCWPREYFSVPEGKTLSRLEYYFTDASGSIKVGYGGGLDPFLFTFTCN